MFMHIDATALVYITLQHCQHEPANVHFLEEQLKISVVKNRALTLEIQIKETQSLFFKFTLGKPSQYCKAETEFLTH